MTDEFTDSPEVAHQPSPEFDEDGGVQQPTPPVLDDAIRQMQATQQDILSRLPAGEEEEPEIEYGTPSYDSEELAGLAEASGLLEGDGTDDLDGVEDLIDERVQEAVTGLAGRLEYDRRVTALTGLAERYPDLQSEATIDEVAGEVERLGAAYGLPPEAASTDPALVELVLQARAGRQAAANEVPAEAGAEGGAILETGAGPSPGQGPEIDAQTKSYLDAIAGTKSSNAFVR